MTLSTFLHKDFLALFDGHFGSGMEEFQEGHFPSEFDIARRLIALVDNERKTYRFSPALAISTVSQELVSFWEIHSNLPIA